MGALRRKAGSGWVWAFEVQIRLTTLMWPSDGANLCRPVQRCRRALALGTRQGLAPSAHRPAGQQDLAGLFGTLPLCCSKLRVGP